MPSLRFVVFVSLLSASLTWLYLLAHFAPDVPGHLKFPSDLEELRAVSDLLTTYMTQSSPFYVLLLFSSAYVFKQTFAVPGSVFLNVLAGAVFGLPCGFALCCVLTAVGATFCYLLARFCLGGEGGLPNFVAVKLDAFKLRLAANADRLTYFLLFLRIFPMSPNWAINVSCGVLRVPIATFFVTVLVGLMPYNFICVQERSFSAHSC
jgi:uncharacterized membrane protein YdjX (TVP38/TMEM64 family)